VSPLRAIVRNELRILRHDPVPLVLLVGMPIVLMALLSQSLGHVLLFEGYDDTPGSMHTAPGMACLFGFFSIAIVGFAIFREHGWRTWPRLRAAGVGGRCCSASSSSRRGCSSCSTRFCSASGWRSSASRSTALGSRSCSSRWRSRRWC
jgi:hypothetical protein